MTILLYSSKIHSDPLLRQNPN